MALVMPHPSTDFQTGKPAPSIHSSDGAAWGGFSELKKLDILMGALNRYSDMASDYTWLSITGPKKDRAFNNKLAIKNTKLFIGIARRMLWMMKKITS